MQLEKFKGKEAKMSNQVTSLRKEHVRQTKRGKDQAHRIVILENVLKKVREKNVALGMMWCGKSRKILYTKTLLNFLQRSANFTMNVIFFRIEKDKRDLMIENVRQSQIYVQAQYKLNIRSLELERMMKSIFGDFSTWFHCFVDVEQMQLDPDCPSCTEPGVISRCPCCNEPGVPCAPPP